MAVSPESAQHMTPEWRPHNFAAPSSSSSYPSAVTFSLPPSPSSSGPMPAVASSSRLPRVRRDVFKPRFPLDPFAGKSVAALAEPWFVKLDALLSATALQRRIVLLVLGAPSLNELAPLLQSHNLANSLVILATHKPPDIPGIVYPTVRILHLSAPLALEDAGAVRFVTVLEWAERIARSWRKHGGTGVQELSEELDINTELAPPSALRFGSQSTPTSPGSSSTHLSTDPSTPSRPSSRPSSIAGSFFTRKTRSLPPPDPSQRPFDAMVNYMPEKMSDKALLKTSILVTTISRPFLASSVHPSPPSLRSRTTSSTSTRLGPQSIFGAFSRSSTSVYLPPTPPYQSGESLVLSQTTPSPPGRALLVHLLPTPPSNVPPAARRKLVESMESFLLSFAYQSIGLSPIQPASGLGLGTGMDALERARPYVTQTTTFCATVASDGGMAADSGEWTVADVVLSGALDADSPTRQGSPTDRSPPMPMMTSASTGAIPQLAKLSKRAWIAAAADLVIMPSSPADASDSANVEAHRHAGSPVQAHIPRPRTEPALPTILQSTPLPGKARSSSAPLLTELGKMSSLFESSPGPPPPTLSILPATVARHGKGIYGRGMSMGPARMQSPLPTPPHSEEESGVECAVDSLDADRAQSASAGSDVSSSQDAAESSIGHHPEGQSGAESGHMIGTGSMRRLKAKWTRRLPFWRRPGGGEAVAAAAVVKV